MASMFTPRCPAKRGGCGKPMVNELDINKTGFETGAGFFIETALRAIVGSGRSPYWCCMNPECRFYSGVHKFWWKMNANMQLEPKSFIAKNFGIYPPKPKKKR